MSMPLFTKSPRPSLPRLRAARPAPRLEGLEERAVPALVVERVGTEVRIGEPGLFTSPHSLTITYLGGGKVALSGDVNRTFANVDKVTYGGRDKADSVRYL